MVVQGRLGGMQAISVSFRLFSHGCPLGVASSASYAPWALTLDVLHQSLGADRLGKKGFFLLIVGSITDR